jgi:hypothetical protein
MEFKRDGYCGLYCGTCPFLLATDQGTVKELAQKKDMKPEDVVCYGCKSEQPASHCTNCGIKQCAREKGFEFCFECNELPCSMMTGFIEDQRYPYHLGVMKNLTVIRQNGVEVWLKVQDARWRCPECHTKFAWQDEECNVCGKPVPNYRADL